SDIELTPALVRQHERLASLQALEPCTGDPLVTATSILPTPRQPEFVLSSAQDIGSAWARALRTELDARLTARLLELEALRDAGRLHAGDDPYSVVGPLKLECGSWRIQQAIRSDGRVLVA